MILALWMMVTLANSPDFAYATRTEQVLPVDKGPVKITVKGTNGHIDVRYGKAGQVDIKSLIRADSVEKLGETSEQLDRTPKELVIRQIDAFKDQAESSHSYQSYSPPIVDLTLAVPHNAVLSIESYNSDIKVEGIAGPAFLKSYNGRISYQVQTGTPMNVYASTRNGRVKSEVLLSTEPKSPIHLETYNGDIAITETARPKHFVNGRFFNGHLFVAQDWYVVDGLATRHAPATVTQVEDLKGAFVAPAYGDAHTHHFEGEYFSKLMVGKYLPEGTLFAQTMTEHISQKAGANKVVNQPDSMDVAYADAGFTATNAHPTFTYEALAANLPQELTPEQRSDRLKGKHTQEGDAYWIVDTTQQLNSAWPKFLASDPDLVKVFLVDTANREKNKNGLMGSFGLDPLMVPLIVRKAHGAGLRVYAHVDTAVDYKVALESGVDGLAHMPGYGFSEGPEDSIKLTPDLAKLAAGHYVQLTAGLAAGYAGKNLKRTQTLQAENIRELRGAGAMPVIGSDSYGSTTAGEVAAWFQLGQSPLQVLTALSKDTPQSIFPWRSVGEIKEGYEADWVILPKDPLVNPSSMLRPSSVLKRGVPVFQSHRVQGVVVDASGKPTAAAVGTSLVISDKAPTCQVGYGQPAIQTDPNGKFEIDENELYSRRLVAVDQGGNVGYVSVNKGDTLVTINLHPSRTLRVELPHPSRVTEPTCSLDFESAGGVLGYATESWGTRTYRIPQGRMDVMVSNSQCRLMTAKTGTASTIKMSLVPTAWVEHLREVAPDIKTTSVSAADKNFSVRQLRGKWVLVDFWAVWCQPCVQELDRIANFYRAHSSQRDKFEILAVHSPDGKSLRSLKEPMAKLEQQYWHGKALPFPLLFDETGKTIRSWGIESYPTTLLIDPEGKLVGPATIADLAAALAKAGSEAPLGDKVPRS